MSQGQFNDTAAVAADGKCTIQIKTNGVVQWRVSQVSSEMLPLPETESVPASADCNLRYNGYLLTPLVPNGDAAGGDPSILLRPSDVLTVEWTGCTPGHLGRVLAIYEVEPY